MKIQIFYLNLSNALVYFAPGLMLFILHLAMQTIRADYLGGLFATSNPSGIGSIIYKKAHELYLIQNCYQYFLLSII